MPKQRILTVLVAAILMVSITVGFIGCGSKGENDKHSMELAYELENIVGLNGGTDRTDLAADIFDSLAEFDLENEGAGAHATEENLEASCKKLWDDLMDDRKKNGHKYTMSCTYERFQATYNRYFTGLDKD